MSKKYKDSEERKYIRLDTVFPVEFRLISLDQKEFLSDLLQGFTRNVNRGGMCLEVNNLDDKLASYLSSKIANLFLRINIPTSDKPIESSATVVWMKNVKVLYPNRYLIGLSYDQVIKKEQDKIMKYVKILHRRSKIIAIAIVIILTIGIAIPITQQLRLKKEKLELIKIAVEIYKDKKKIEEELPFINNEKKLLEIISVDIKNKVTKMEKQVSRVKDKLLANKKMLKKALKEKKALETMLGIIKGKIQPEEEKVEKEVKKEIKVRPTYIRNWLICGPFENSNLETTCFEDEGSLDSNKGQVSAGKKWRESFSLKDIVDFEEGTAFGHYENCVGYAYLKIYSSEEKEVKLLLKSDDGIKVWLNGSNILTNDIARGLNTKADDIVNIVLKPNWNRLLIKVNNIGGGWGFSAQLLNHDNSAISGLSFNPEALAIERLPVKKVIASSTEGDKDNFSPVNVIDGNKMTRWSSNFSDPQWICLDLGRPMKIFRIYLEWEKASAKIYRIETSLYSKTWNEIYSTESGDGSKNILVLPTPQIARFIRMYGTERNTQWGYSLCEFEAYGWSEIYP